MASEALALSESQPDLDEAVLMPLIQTALHGDGDVVYRLSQLAVDRATNDPDIVRAAVFAATALRLDPSEAETALNGRLAGVDAGNQRSFAENLLPLVFGSRYRHTVPITELPFSTLVWLVRTSFQTVRPEDDVERFSGQVYSPELRDDAQDHAADRGRGGRRAALDRGADRDLRALAQRRPRGERARHRERGRRDPERRARSRAALRRRRGHGGRGRGGSALRPAAAPLHPHGARGRRGFGEVFRRGATVGCLLAAANRDTARFASPHRFDPARAGPPQLAFGAGLHFCVGAPLARLELGVALPILFDRLPAQRLAAPPVYADRYHFRGLERLELRRGP